MLRIRVVTASRTCPSSRSTAGPANDPPRSGARFTSLSRFGCHELRMLPKIGFYEGAPGDHAQPLGSYRFERPFRERARQPAPTKGWRHFRMREHDGAGLSLVLQKRHLSVDLELEPRGVGIVPDGRFRIGHWRP